jgi:hypothetical protein
MSHSVSVMLSGTLIATMRDLRLVGAFPAYLRAMSAIRPRHLSRITTEVVEDPHVRDPRRSGAFSRVRMLTNHVADFCCTARPPDIRLEYVDHD